MDKLDYDFVVVGSGINSLVCAALLTKAGHGVCVLERNDRLGGCIRTEEITLPGFRHEGFFAVHPLVVTSPAFEELQACSTLFPRPCRPTATGCRLISAQIL